MATGEHPPFAVVIKTQLFPLSMAGLPADKACDGIMPPFVESARSIKGSTSKRSDGGGLEIEIPVVRPKMLLPSENTRPVISVASGD